jgi:chromosome segregation ATPase
MVQNLALLLQGESESLQREQSNTNLDADKFAKDSTPLIQEITTLKSQIIQMSSERDSIAQHKEELLNTWRRDFQTENYWTDQFLHSADLNQLQEFSDKMAQATAVAEASNQAYQAYFLPALDRLRTIDQSISQLQPRVSDLQANAEQVSQRYQDAQNNLKQLQIFLQANITDQQTLQQIGSL